MFRSIRAAKAKSRRAKSIANSRQLLLESLEQRRLLSASPGLALAPLNVTSPAAFYGPVQGGVGERAGINLRAEGEGESTPDTARQLLFAGIAGSTASPTNSGLLTIIDATPNSPTDTIVPWKAPVLSGGIAGLAFDLSGRLFAAVDQGPCTPSELVELNPADGTAIRRLPIMAGSTQINIGDLAVEPSTGKLFGTRSIRDDANHAGELFIIDVDSGAATFVGDTGTRTGEGLAFAADGALYLAGTAGGKPVLYKIDPATAEPHQRDAVTGRAIPLVVLNDPTGRLKEIEGLVGHPDNGTLIATTSMTRPAANQIVDDTYVIDLSTGKVTARPLASPARGIFGDLAFQPSPHALDIFYQENFEDGIGGFVTDNTGGTLPGLWHYSLGRRFDKLPSHTPISSFYYGAFETAFGDGHYVLPLDHEGTLTSPQTDPLPTSSVLSFNYLLDTRPELDVDFVTVSVITADGNITQILSRADGTLPQTGRQKWRTATADLSAFACQPIQLQFSFDTGAAPIIDPEGWYLDDLMIGSTGGICDFGDAPDDPANPNDYPTLLVSNGARHGVVDGFHLGKVIDDETDGQPTAMADGDDNNGLPDEDGVTFVPIDPARTGRVLFVGQEGTAVVDLMNTTGKIALLDAWIDFDQDGEWTDSEQIAMSRTLTIGMNANTITFPVPVDAKLGDTFARFRMSSTGGLKPDGPANDGEVEDYKVTIEPWLARIEIVKTGVWNNEKNNGRADDADKIDYKFTVTNTGNVTLLGVKITDKDLLGLTLGDLLPGAMVMATRSYMLTADDVTARMKMNTAVAEGTAPNGDLIRAEDTAIVLLPSIDLVKTNVSPNGWNDLDNNGRPDAKETIDYEFKVTNDGKLPLLNVTVTDSDLDITVSPLSGALTDEDHDGMADDLAPGAMATATGTYALKQADIDACEKINTATTNATDPNGNAIFHKSSVRTILPGVPIIEIDKFLFNNADDDGSGKAKLNDRLTYHFKVKNAGNQTLTNVSVNDPLLGLSTIVPNGVPRLAPGETATFSATYKVQQSDMDDPDMEINNTATVTATDPKNKPLSSMDSEAVMVKWRPVVIIDKFLSNNDDKDHSGTVTKDDTLTYSFKVTNDGLQTLTNVSVSDPLPGLSPITPSGTPRLAPGETVTFSATYKVRQSDMDDPDMEINNTATVTATDPKNKPLSSMDSQAVMVKWRPVVIIDKFLSNNDDKDHSGTVTKDDTLTYSFEVTNAGLQTLTNVSVTDPLPGLSPITPSRVPRLAPGEAVTFSATYKVRQSDMDDPDMEINNTATVTATDPKNKPQFSMDSEAVMIEWRPRVIIDKFLSDKDDKDHSGTVTKDDTLTYSFKVTNDGLQTLTNVSVTDPLPGLSPITPSRVPRLAPGETVTFSATYKVSQSDATTGKITNTATATGTDPKGVPQKRSDTEMVPVQRLPPPPTPQVVQFITPMSLFRPDGPSTKPPSDQLAITGFVWDDSNNDGVWQAGEVGLNDVPVYIDLNGNGVRDEKEPAVQTTNDASGDGSYWFAKSLFSGVLPGTFTLRVDLPGATPTRFPGNARHDVTLDKDGQLFGAFQRAESPNFGLPAGAFAGTVAISGYKWHDLNQDGVWDANEPGRAGWSIYIDLNGDNILDPETEPLAITDEDGRYVFTANDLMDLEAGESYAIREDRFGLSDGIFQVQRFPAADPTGARDPDEHLIRWMPGTTIQGRLRMAEAPNFSTFDYSPFIRPADEQLRRFQDLPDIDKPGYLAVLSPWQSIEITNTTGSRFNITGFDTSHIVAPGNLFVSVVDASGTLIGLSNLKTVEPDSSLKLYVFYDPAIRSGDTVSEQFPDWQGSKIATNARHAFIAGDRLTILTDSSATFPVNLVGGSTYDSDIVYDGAVDRRDFERLNDEILDGGRNWPVAEALSPFFDVTSDINNRCPNGAEGILGTCGWGLHSFPDREIALGDFGTLNAEFNRARAPFLDLDSDNSSGAQGADYAAEFMGLPILIADVDARFANRDIRVLQELAIIAPEGDSLIIDASKLPVTITAQRSETEPNRVLLTGIDPQSGATVGDFMKTLTAICFAPRASTTTRIAEITFVAKGLAAREGDPASLPITFTRLQNDAELLGNAAVARILVRASN